MSTSAITGLAARLTGGSVVTDLDNMAFSRHDQAADPDAPAQ